MPKSRGGSLVVPAGTSGFTSALNSHLGPGVSEENSHFVSQPRWRLLRDRGSLGVGRDLPLPSITVVEPREYWVSVLCPLAMWLWTGHVLIEPPQRATRRNTDPMSRASALCWANNWQSLWAKSSASLPGIWGLQQNLMTTSPCLLPA